MKRITPEIKAIADAHLKAIADGKFDNPVIHSKEELMEALKQGKTFSEVVNQIEVRFMSIGSTMFSRMLGHQSQSYRNGIYKGFKQIFA